MKSMNFLITAFFIISFSAYAQKQNTFKFTDSIVKSGYVKEIPYVYFLCGNIEEDNLKTFDSIKIFLERHEQLILELGVHFSNGSVKRTYEYGVMVKNELGYRNVDTSRIIVKGYGNSEPKVSHITHRYLKRLYKDGNYYEAERLHMINDRIELKILTE